MVKLVLDKYSCMCASCGKKSDDPNDFRCLSIINSAPAGSQHASYTTGGLCRECRKELLKTLIDDLV